MADETIFSSEYCTEPPEPAPSEAAETNSLDMPGTDPIALGDAIVKGLRQYGTGKPQWQVIKATIRHA